MPESAKRVEIPILSILRGSPVATVFHCTEPGLFGELDVLLVDNLDITKDLINLLERLASGLGIGKCEDGGAESIGQNEQNLDVWLAHVFLEVFYWYSRSTSNRSRPRQWASIG